MVVDAIQVSRGNVDELIKFTKGGTMIIPRCINAHGIYTFSNGDRRYEAPELSIS